ncbi:MAG: HD domain-containing phosphohydrolase [Acidobacteriota bacterium]
MSTMSVSEREGMLRHLLVLMMDQASARKGALYVLDPKANQLFLRLREGFAADDYIRFKLKASDPAVVHVTHSTQPTIVNDGKEVPELADLMAESGAENMLLCPIMARGVMIGLVDLRDRRKGRFREGDAEAITGPSDEIAEILLEVPRTDTAERRALEQPTDSFKKGPETSDGLSRAVIDTLAKSGAIRTVHDTPSPTKRDPTGRIRALPTPAQSLPRPPRPLLPPTEEMKVPELPRTTEVIDRARVEPPVMEARGPEPADGPRREERRKRLHLSGELLREVLPVLFRVTPLDFLALGILQEDTLELAYVSAAPVSGAVQVKLRDAARRGLLEAPIPGRRCEIQDGESLTLQESAMELSGDLAPVVVVAVPLAKSGPEAKDYLVMAALQVERLGFGSDSTEILTQYGATLRHLLLQRLRTHDYRGSYLSLLNQLLKPIEGTLPYIKAHSLAVASLSKQIAQALSLDELQVESIIVAAILHDVGHMDIDFHTGKDRPYLSEEEWEEIKKHPRYSKDYVEQLAFPYPVAPIVYAHHERWDGTGYPEGKKGDEIPLGARILAVADAYDVMTSKHSHKVPIAPAQALDEIKAHSGTQFDPLVVDVFLRVARKTAKR